MDAPGAERGRFVWHELMTTDVEAAKTFYGAVVGWTVAPPRATTPDTPPEYTVWMGGEAARAGLLNLPDAARAAGAAPFWMAYVEVPDPEAVCAEAVARGGSVLVSPESVPGVGRFAVLQDPQGAVFAVMHSETAGEPEGDPPPLSFAWNELYAADRAAAEPFYGALFGWEGRGDFDLGPMGTYHTFGRDRFTYGGMLDKPADLAAPPHWLHYVRVPSADVAAERAAAHGGRVLHGPMDVPGGGRIAILADPQGAVFGVLANAA